MSGESGSERLRAATRQLRERLDAHAEAVGIDEAEASVRRVRDRALAELRAASSSRLDPQAIARRLLAMAHELVATEAIAEAAREERRK